VCGFVGEVRFDDRDVALDRLERMASTMSDRGPDASGILGRGRTALAHRRLKIIDLSESSQQPMVDSELGLSIAFNGAIYNYKELRQSLEQLGYRFFSNGDTEVLLKGYHAWGDQLPERLYGMFAFAIVERDSGALFLARDRLGIKPLYLADVPGGLRFGSTLPALLAGGEVDTSIDPVALHHYLTFHAVVPPPHTILNGVRKLPPAHTLRVDVKGNRETRQYWSCSFETPEADRDVSFEEWQDRVLEALRNAVQRRLVADVPVGVLLSGGLDSSLVVGLLAEAGQTGLETFSIGFETVGSERGDEFEYSDIIAKHFGTKHHKIFIDSSKALPNLPKCIAAMSEPMVSHDAIGFYLLSEEVSKYVRVVQSGQGADEIFAGYRWYPPLLERESEGAAEAAEAYARVFFDRDHEELGTVVHPRFFADDHSAAFVRAHFGQPGAGRAIERALRLDTTVMLVDDPVKRVDNMTMAWGLEARVPFLDREVVEVGAQVPSEMKVGGGGKHVLKEAARRLIPSEVIDRKKGYFPMPALKYLRGPYLGLVSDALTSQTARERDLFRPSYVERLLADPDAHITPLQGSKLWQLALLELWLQQHGV
jgi:asparagine synthase (glutamine-hydrolysing)